MKQPKTYTIKYTRFSYAGTSSATTTGTIQELIEHYRYTLECGKAYENERGNKKINIEPKTIKSLVTNLNNAANNATANGKSGKQYALVTE